MKVKVYKLERNSFLINFKKLTVSRTGFTGLENSVDAVNSVTPGICSGHNSGEFWSSLSCPQNRSSVSLSLSKLNDVSSFLFDSVLVFFILYKSSNEEKTSILKKKVLIQKTVYVSKCQS